MTWLEFFAAIVGALAWPVALLLVVLTFENPIRELLRNIRTLSWNNLVANIARSGQSAEEHRQMAEETGVVSKALVGESAVERLSALVEVSPRGAVLEAWVMLENDLKEASVETASPNLHREPTFSSISTSFTGR